MATAFGFGCSQAEPAPPADAEVACVPEIDFHEVKPTDSGPIDVLGSIVLDVGEAVTACEGGLEWVANDEVIASDVDRVEVGCDRYAAGTEVIVEVRLTIDGAVVASNSWLLEIDCPAAGWQTHEPLPYKVTENVAAAVGDMIYVMGGFVGFDIPADVWRYEPATGQWSQVAPMPLAGYHHTSLVEVGSKLYVVATHFGIGLEPAADTLEYDPATDAWTPKTLQPVVRGAAGAAPIDSKIYVAGGVTDQGFVGTMSVYDPATDEWDLDQPPMALAREHVAACALDGRLHILGGRRGGLNNVDAHEAYDPATDEWIELDPLPTARSGFVGAVLNGRCHVVGGEQTSGTFATHEAWSPEAGWETLPDMPSPRHGLGAAVVGSRIYVLGGGPDPGFSFSSANESFGL